MSRLAAQLSQQTPFLMGNCQGIVLQCFVQSFVKFWVKMHHYLLFRTGNQRVYGLIKTNKRALLDKRMCEEKGERRKEKGKERSFQDTERFTATGVSVDKKGGCTRVRGEYSSTRPNISESHSETPEH